MLLKIAGFFSSLCVNEIAFCVSPRFVPHPSVGQLGCFNAWAIVITAVMNVGVQVSFFFFLINLFILFIYFWLRWVFVAARGLSLVAASRGYSSLWCAGFSLRWLLLLQSTGSRRAGSVVVACGLWSAGSVVPAHGPSCSAACGIFPDQGSNPCPLRWQVDS